MAKKKKEKPAKLNRVSRCVKQHVSLVSDETELFLIAERYKNVKNYVYSRYSGIHSLILLEDYKKEIRDVWVKSKFAEQWKLPARYWKLALDDGIANIKSKWSNVKNDIKSAIRTNTNVTEDERHFIYYILKSNELLHGILTHKKFKKPKKLEILEIREKYIFNLIRRYVRKYKKGIPYSKKANGFSIDRPMYDYYEKDGKNFIEITSTVPRNRMAFELKDKNVFGGNIRIVIDGKTVRLHHNAKKKERKLTKVEHIIGLDKGHKTLLATSTGNLYGVKLNELLNKETERLKEVNAKRNPYYATVRNLEENAEFEKAERIRNNNLGKKKYDRNKNKYDETTKSFINKELNRFIFEEKPSEIIQEDLSFVSWDNRFPKQVKRKLSRWIKGYIKVRIEFKCDLYGIKYTKVNAAYTSQVCSCCGNFGVRNGDVFMCKNCGKKHADVNASINVLKRKNDKEITTYTPFKKVKKILEDRISTKIVAN